MHYMESLQLRNQDNVATKEGQKTYVPGFNDTSAGAKPDSHLNKHKLLNPDVGHIDITLEPSPSHKSWKIRLERSFHSPHPVYPKETNPL